MITGVLSAAVEPLGRRTSACSVASPALDGDEIHASVQSASGYATPAADAADGIAAKHTIVAAKASLDRTDMCAEHPPVPVYASAPLERGRNLPGCLSWYAGRPQGRLWETA